MTPGGTTVAKTLEHKRLDRIIEVTCRMEEWVGPAGTKLLYAHINELKGLLFYANDQPEHGDICFGRALVLARFLGDATVKDRVWRHAKRLNREKYVWAAWYERLPRYHQKLIDRFLKVLKKPGAERDHLKKVMDEVIAKPKAAKS